MPNGAILTALAGILIGSFVNALVWRLKNKNNWITGRSECSSCGHSLSFLDLVPIFSYLFLRGKCRYCHNKIDDSPLTELGVGFAFLFSYLYWPLEFEGLGLFRFYLWLLCIIIMAAMFLFDFKWSILPDKLTRSLLYLAILQFIAIVIVNGPSWSLLLSAFASMAIGGGLFHLIYELSKGKYIGGGDIKLGYAYGLLLIDPLMSWMVLTIASVLGSTVAIVLIVLNSKTLRSSIPFGPFLIIGLFITVLLGQEIWSFANSLMLY